MILKKKKPITTMFGPYFRINRNSKWHWSVPCTDFPIGYNKLVYRSDREPDKSSLCPQCMEIEKSDKHNWK